MLLESSLQWEAMTLNTWHAVWTVVIVRVSISVLGTEVQALEGEHLSAATTGSEPVMLLPDKADPTSWIVTTWPQWSVFGSLWLFHPRLNRKVLPPYETLLHFQNRGEKVQVLCFLFLCHLMSLCLAVAWRGVELGTPTPLYKSKAVQFSVAWMLLIYISSASKE